jgi:hypothetical protein
MPHLSIRLPDADLALLKAEASRQGKDVSEILRDLIRLACRPADPSRLEKIAALQVLILDAKDGRYLVSPDDPADLSTLQIWVKPSLVIFDHPGLPSPGSAQAIYEDSKAPAGVGEILQFPSSTEVPAIESKPSPAVESKDEE